MQLNSSIADLPVTFRSIVKSHTSAVTHHVNYKVRAELNVEGRTMEQLYWFGRHRTFLRQRDQKTGKTSLKIGCSSAQRLAIRKLVRQFNSAH